MIRRVAGISSFRTYLTRKPEKVSRASAASRKADCALGEHRFEVVDRLSSPPLWKCPSCGVFAFVKHKVNGHRNGRFVVYHCSTESCSEPARIKSQYRGSGGSFDWACGAVHATGKKFAHVRAAAP